MRSYQVFLYEDPVKAAAYTIASSLLPAGSNPRWCVVRRQRVVCKISYCPHRDPTGFSAGGGNGDGEFDVGERVTHTPYFSVGSLTRKAACKTLSPTLHLPQSLPPLGLNPVGL